MAKRAKKVKKVKVTLARSKFHRKPGHAETARGLGLRKRHDTVEVADTPENRGMIRKIRYMLDVEES